MATKRAATTEAGAEEQRPLFSVDMSELFGRRKMSGREVREFERVQPVKYSNLMKVVTAGDIPWDTFLGMIYILRRRQDPTFTFDDLLDLTEDDYEVTGVDEQQAGPTAEPVAAPTGS